MELRGSVDMVGAVPVLALTGSVDLATVGTFRDLLLRLVTGHHSQRVVVDLDGVAVLDDTGLGIVLGAAGRARQDGGDLVVVCSDPRLRERFTVTGLDRAIEITASLAEVVSPQR